VREDEAEPSSPAFGMRRKVSQEVTLRMARGMAHTEKRPSLGMHGPTAALAWEREPQNTWKASIPRAPMATPASM